MSVRVTLNGVELTVDGTPTVFDVARQQGIEIPNLCQSEGRANGVCRLCMVELDASGRAVPSCSTRVRDGMVVKTDTPHLRELRRGLLTLLLAGHGAHPKQERCELERFAAELRVPWDGRNGSPARADDSHPAIRFDPSLCILCRKCLVACNEDQLNEVIALAGRGHGVRVAFDLGVALGESSCASCGACVDACPTGALQETGWRPAERTVVTTCPYCAVGCRIEYGIAADTIVWARGADGSANRGRLCVKGKFAFQHESSPDRLRTPLIRKPGVARGPLAGRDLLEVFRLASWDEALDLVAQQIRRTREAHGVEAIGGIASDRSTNEDVFAFQKFLRAAVGTDNVDQSATLCHSPSAAMLSWALGAGAATNPIADLAHARTILLVGSSTEAAHPVIAGRIKRAARDGAHLIVVDPRTLGMSRFAEFNLALRPGTDVALFSAMAKYILDQGWEDRAFIDARTEGFEAWRESLAPFTMEFASRVTGLKPGAIRAAAELYATRTPSVILWTLGITEHANGSDNVSSLVNLALLTGNVGRPGSGLNPIRGQNNVQGGADMGATPGSLPGYQDLFDPSTRARFEAKWHAKLPERKGWKSTEMIQLARGGLLRLLYISGENSIRSHPDSQSVAEAFRKLDFLVVEDLFLTETAEYADVVLPAASSFEKGGTFTNTERRVQPVRPIRPPVGEARTDWEIYAALAARLGHPMDYEDSAQVLAEIAELAPSYAGVGPDALARGGVQWPVAAGSPDGTPILHVGRFARGKGRFRPLTWTDRGADDDGFPYALLTGRQREHYHTGTMTRRSPVVSAITRGPEVEMNADDMKSEGFEDGDRVRLVSKQGAVEARVRASPTVPRRVLFTTFHYAELPVNVLTPPVLDPQTRTPAYKDTRVRVERIGEPDHA